jgi:glyoxylase-like metal-dependent hydrolase (beta-lactamase superfamily II)
MDNLLFTGDTLFAGSIGRTDLPGGSFRDIMLSIQNKILPLGDHITIYPGHGPSSTISKERRTNPFITDVGKGYY